MSGRKGEHISTDVSRRGVSTHWWLGGKSEDSVIIEVGERGVNLRKNITEAERFVTWGEILELINADAEKDQWVADLIEAAVESDRRACEAKEEGGQ